jgi:hypothetical protein
MTKRTLEGWAKQRALVNAIKKRKRQDPEFRAKEAAKAREYYYKNKEKVDQIAKNWWKRNKEMVREKRRQARITDPAKAKSDDKKWRHNRIKSWIARFKRGDCSLDQLNRRLRESFTRYDGELERLRCQRSDDGLRSGEASSEPGESED